MSKIEINLNELLELSITPNQYAIAYLIHLKEFDEVKKLRKTYKKDLYFKEDILNLVLSGFMKNPSSDIKNIKISECKIINLFDEVNVTDVNSEWDDFVDKFRKLFPSGVTSGGYYVRSSKIDCSKKLKDFIKKYPDFDTETILEATERYIARARLNNYKFMKIATYFISKDKMSILASECEQVTSGESSEGNVLSGGV